MKAVATIFLLPLFIGVLSWQEGEPNIQGTYDMVWRDGEFLPTEDLTSGSLELSPDSTWRITMINEAVPVRSSIWGGYSVGEEKNGCTHFESWRNNTPDQRTPSIVCDGVLTWRDSRWPVDAVFRKRE